MSRPSDRPAYTGSSDDDGFQHPEQLAAPAAAAMRERRLDPVFPTDALAQASALTAAPVVATEPVKDLRELRGVRSTTTTRAISDQLSAAEQLMRRTHSHPRRGCRR
jgi:hypothetical protein